MLKRLITKHLKSLRPKSNLLSLLLFFLLFSHILPTKAQESEIGHLELYGLVEKDKKPIPNAVVKAYENKKQISTATTNNKGMFQLNFEFGHEIDLLIEKDGYFPVEYNIQTSLIEDDYKYWVYKHEIITEMIPKVDEINKDLLTGRTIYIDYDNRYEDFIVNLAKTGTAFERSRKLKEEVDIILKNLEKYNKLISEADLQFKIQKYEKALDYYQQALDAIPSKKYPKDKIAEINQILEDLRNLEQNYNKYIAEADRSFNSLQYERAKENYQKALNLKPQEQYPKVQIDKINLLLAEMLNKEKAYKKYIAQADSLFNLKNYQESKFAYEKASNVLPNEPYPKDQIKKINQILAETNQRKEGYDKAIADGDRFLSLGQYDQAKKSYQDALAISPDEQYPKTQIAKIDKLIADKTGRQQAYDKAIAEGDQAFANKEYVKAQSAYQTASNIFPEEKYPKDKLAELAKILAQLKNREEAYNNLIKEADLAFNAKNYSSAKTNYQEALTIFNDRPYPKEQIAKIDQLLANQSQQDQAYNNAIKLGDSNFKQKNLSEAKKNYQTALGIRPNESYPKEKIAEIDKLLGEQQSKQSAYDAAIAKADEFFNQKDYQNAKTNYQLALSIIPGQQYPLDQITKINQLLKISEENNKAYQEAIEKADGYFADKKYTDAKTYYQQALQIKPNESYPKNKITEIDMLFADLKSKNEAYQKAIAEGDALFNQKQWETSKASYQKAASIFPNEEYPTKRIAEINNILTAQLSKQQAYDKAIAEGDNMFNTKQYKQSLNAYQSASAIFPEKEYPIKRIAEINQLLADLKIKEEQYKKAVEDGDALFKSQSYEESLKAFQTAFGLFPERPYPKQKIDEINKILSDKMSKQQAYDKAIAEADKAFNSNSYDIAKVNYNNAALIMPDKQYPKDQLAKIEQILSQMAIQNQKYSDAIMKGDKAFNEQNYQEAKTQYQIASGIKPNEQYPKDKIQQIDQLLSTLKQKNEAYNSAIAAADAAFKNQDYPAAKTNYQKALSIFPERPYPAEKIKEIDAILLEMQGKLDKYNQLIANGDKLFNIKDYPNALNSYNQALAIFSDKQYPKDQINAINKLLGELQAKQQSYNVAIANGDKAFAAKQYDVAKQHFQQAISVLPNETYPKEKIKEIDQILAENNKRKQYEDLISLADKDFNINKYEEAKANYQKASVIYPNEQYPKEQINKIVQLIQDIALKRKQYDDAIAEADNAFNSKIYDKAKNYYQTASQIFPDEKYPKDRLLEINTLLSQMENAQKAYSEAIAKADALFEKSNYQEARTYYTNASAIKPAEQYPKDKIAQIDKFLGDMQQKENDYKKAIEEGDKYLSQKSYNNAKTFYTNALAIFPDRSYPKEKLQEISDIVNAQAGTEQNYKRYISQGDQFFTGKNYDLSLESYKKALQIKPNEKYPKERIEEINQILKDNIEIQKFYAKGFIDIASNQTIAKNSEKKYNFVSFDQRKNGSYASIKIKNTTGKPINVFLNYGKGLIKNGGFTFKVSEEGGTKEYKIDLSTHSQWIIYRNNWISLYPLGGDITVEDLRIYFGN